MTTAEKFKKELENTAQFIAVEKKALKACEEKSVVGNFEFYYFKDRSVLKVVSGGRKIETYMNEPKAPIGCKKCGQLCFFNNDTCEECIGKESA